MRVLIVLLLAATVQAQDPELTISLEKSPVREIAALLSRLSGTKIEVDSDYADRKVTVDTKATVAEIVGTVAKSVGAEMHRAPDGTMHIVPAWKARLLQGLAKRLTRVVWKKHEVTVNDACQYVRSVAGLNLLLDGSARANAGIAVDVENVTVRELLDLVATGAKAEWRLRFGVIHLATADRLAELPDRVPWQDDKLLQREFDVPFSNTRLDVVATYCKAATGVDIVFSPKAKEEAESVEVTLLAAKLTLAQVLALTLPPAGLKATVEDDVVKIEAAE